MNLLAFATSAADTLRNIFCGPIVGESITWADELTALVRILIAAFLGLIIGIERNRRQKEAGIATHVIVASASALFTIISTSIAFSTGADGARIAAGVVTGVGFLGSGIIFFRRESMRGLTTAAGIWATAAMSMCIAVGQIILAVGVLLIIMTVQLIVHSKMVTRRGKKHLLFVKFIYSNETNAQLREHFGCNNFHRVKITKDGDKMIAEVVVYTKQNFYATELSDYMSENPAILSIERLEDL